MKVYISGHTPRILPQRALRELVDGGIFTPSQAVGMMPRCPHCGARYADADFAEHCRAVGDAVHLAAEVMSS